MVQGTSVGGTSEAFVVPVAPLRTADDATSGAGLTAVVSGTNTTGLPPLNVSLFGGESADPDSGKIIHYIWDFGDGTTASTLTDTTTHTYNTAGLYVVGLQVQNNIGVLGQPAYLPAISRPLNTNL